MHWGMFRVQGWREGNSAHLHSLLDTLRGARIVLGVQLGQEEGVDEGGFTQTRLTWEAKQKNV